MKKIVSLILSCIMLLSMTAGMNLTVLAADKATSGSCGENLTWRYDTSENTLTIFGTGAMTDYQNDKNNSESFAPWYEDYISKIQTVALSDGVTSIGNNSFNGCSNLTSVTIPDSVTSLGDKCFANCTKLTNAKLSENLTVIGNRAFSNCRNLSNVTLYNELKTIGDNVFYNCKNITEITIPKSVTSIGASPFVLCDKLKTIKVEKGNSVYSTDNDVALLGKEGKELVQFAIANDMTEYTVPKTVTTIKEYAFSKNPTLTKVSLSENVTTIEKYAFYYCSKLESVVIPKAVTQIGESSFFGCKKLTDIYYSGTKAEWNKIALGEQDEDFATVKINYNSTGGSKTDPTPTPGGDSGSTGGGTSGGSSIGGGGAPVPEVPAETPDTTPTAPTASTTKPATVKVTGTKSKTKALSVYWNKIAGVSGYQIQVATDKNFKKNKKTVTVAKQNASKKTVKELKKNKKYYVRVRAYKTVNGKKIYGNWSKVKSVKTK